MGSQHGPERVAPMTGSARDGVDTRPSNIPFQRTIGADAIRCASLAAEPERSVDHHHPDRTRWRWLQLRLAYLAGCLVVAGSGTTAEVSAGPGTQSSWSERVVSVVGPITSGVSESYSDGPVRPVGGCSLIATRKPEGERADLTDLFDEDDLLYSLSNAWPVMNALGLRRPRSYPELMEVLVEDCTVPWDTLPYSFAIMEYGELGAVVRLGLGGGCGSQGYNTEFDVLVAVPEDRRHLFEEAAKSHSLGTAETCGGTHEWSCCLRWRGRAAERENEAQEGAVRHE